MPSIYPTDTQVRVDPGDIGSNKFAISFVNTSGFTITDVRITTFDDDWYGSRPEILEGEKGCKLFRFHPKKGEDGSIVAEGETELDSDECFRSDDGEESGDVTIELGAPAAIKPGEGLTISLEFDEELNGNEGVQVSFSRWLDGKHVFFTSRPTAFPGPMSWEDLAKALGQIAQAVGGLVQGSTTPGSSRSSIKARIAAVTQQDRTTVSLKKFPDTPLEKLSGISATKLSALRSAGFSSVRDIVNDPVIGEAIRINIKLDDTSR